MGRNFDTVNLMCFPYAGGSQYSYNSFKAVAPTGLNVIPIELPGRGDRVKESLLVDIESMVNDQFNQLKNYINRPYILYGHSMGAILCYLVAEKIASANLPLPQHLIVTGCEGPSAKEKNQKRRSHLPQDEFLGELKALGGLPHEILMDTSFLDFFEPILRTDFKAVEDYQYLKSAALNIPICVIYGSEEDFSFAEASAWQKESNFDVEVIELPGDHFFIFRHERQIMNIIEKKLKQQRVKSLF